MDTSNSKERQMVDVSFRAMFDSIDPDHISQLLQLRPTHSHSAGEHRVVGTRCIPWKRGIWILKSEMDTDADLEHHIDSLLNILEPKRAELASLVATGCELDFYCGIIRSQCSVGFTLSRTLLARISALDLSLGVCCYCFDSQ